MRHLAHWSMLMGLGGQHASGQEMETRAFPTWENQKGNASICESAIEHKPSCN